MTQNWHHPAKGMSKQSYRNLWRKRVKAWQASGMSRIAYAQATGLNKWALCDWVKRFESELKTATISGDKSEKLIVTKPATLIPVRVQGGSAVTQMKLSLRDGIMLEWSQPPQAQWLLELLKGLA